MAVVVCCYVGNNLLCLVVYGGEAGVVAYGEAIHLGGNDMELIFEKFHKRSENLVRHPKTRDEQQRGCSLCAKFFKSHNYRQNGLQDKFNEKYPTCKACERHYYFFLCEDKNYP